MKNSLQTIILSTLIFFSCSKLTDKEYMEIAVQYEQSGNIPEAVINYQKLIDEYPGSDMAPEALVKQATLYHENKVKNIAAVESYKKAAELFISVSEKYSDSEQAPSSLFMAGFIYANDIKDFNKAKEIYNKFLKKYPGDELASSAKDELEFMGLPPEEILKRKITSNQTQ
jgi:TolA-binding protein